MSTEEEKFQNSRVRKAYVGTVLSITLVLIMLGVQGLVLVYSQKLSNHIKENIGFSILIKNNSSEADILKLKTSLDSNKFVKSTNYITKEMAAENLKEQINSDFISFLGFNPLSPIIDVNLNAKYLQNDSIKSFITSLDNENIDEIYYQKDLVSFVNTNIKRISILLLAISALTLLISIFLINSTMRLLIHTKRFTINTMQLVGANASFIRKPFTRNAFKQALSASILAIISLSMLLLILQKHIPQIVNYDDSIPIIAVFIVITIIGILFTVFSARISANKYIRMRNSDNIYS